MSRQNKQARVIARRKEVTAKHKQGGKVGRTQKLTSVNKGKRITERGVRRSISLSNKRGGDGS